MQKADRSFSLRASCFQIRKKQRYSVDGLMMFSCKGIQGMDLREISFDHVLNVGGGHRLFLGCSLSGYKDSMQGLSGLGVCLCVCFKGFWSLAKAFGDHLFFAHGFLLREDYFRFPVMHFGGESVL